jgi:hypothetical protein
MGFMAVMTNVVFLQHKDKNRINSSVSHGVIYCHADLAG